MIFKKKESPKFTCFLCSNNLEKKKKSNITIGENETCKECIEMIEELGGEKILDLKLSIEEMKQMIEDSENYTIEELREMYPNMKTKEEIKNEKKEKERKRIIKTQIVTTENGKKSTSSSIVRGAIGGAILGPAGLVGGAASGKNKKGKTTFLIKYNDGSKEILTVTNNSLLFNEYCKYLDD